MIQKCLPAEIIFSSLNKFKKKRSTAYTILLKLRKLFYGDLNNKSTEYVDKNTYFVGDCFVIIVKLNREVRKVFLLLFVMN